MKTSILFSIFISFSALAEDIQTTCERTVLEEKLVPVRIPDSDLPFNQITPIFRSPNLHASECLHHKSSGQCNIYGVNNTILFNSAGYSVDSWNQLYPNTPFSGPVSYCSNCNELNTGTLVYGTGSSYAGILTGFKYKGCKDKTNTSSDNNTDGCYTFKIEKIEKIESYPCTIYICKETDNVPGHFGVNTGNFYPCQVQCMDFNFPATWNFRQNAYVCLPPPPEPDPDPEPEGCDGTKAESWKCLKNETKESLNETKWDISDYFDSIYTKLEDYFIQRDQENNNEPETPENPDNSTMPNAELPTQEHGFSASQLLDDLFPTNATCPNDTSINLLAKTYSFSYITLCEYAQTLGNLVMALSIYAALRILRK